MAAPGPALGPLTYLVIRSFVRDLPEDFLTRIDAGIDDALKPGLELGLRAARAIDRLMNAAVWTLIAGGVALLLSVPAWSWSPDVGRALVSVSVASGLLAVAEIAAVGTIFLLRRRDLHLLYGYVKAARRSSLARDLQ